MDLIAITPEFQIGLILMELDEPIHITFSTYDLDMTLFVMEFYSPDIEYDIWYWILIKPMNEIPFNVHLHQLNNNHCKFWYIETKRYTRLVITSCNLTNQMIHECFQSYCSITRERSEKYKLGREPVNKFFSIFGVELDYNIFQAVKDKIVFNIPNEFNGIELWYKKQHDIIIDCNNLNLNYLKEIKKTFIIRQPIPPTVSNIVCYYSMNYKSDKVTTVELPFIKLFHYKLYYTDKCVLLSSNNFSFNHKNNFELGILIDEKR